MIDYKRLSQETFDREAAAFDGPERPGHVRTLYPQLRPLLAGLSFRSVLDIGCGTGELLARLEEWQPAHLAGLDISANMIAAAREKLGPQVDLHVGDAESLPWPDGSFDLVTCTNSFHHYPDPTRALAEIKRVLIPGGWLVLADIALPPVARTVANWLLPWMRTGDVHFYARHEIEKLLTAGRFRLENYQPVDGSFIALTQEISVG
jgi:ubiquinone/menaquinone biosynthesis C-methylase UbiE